MTDGQCFEKVFRLITSSHDVDTDTNYFFAELCKSGGDEERFLLASASLANLSFLTPEAIEIMREISTAQVLIRTARSHQMIVFAKDQVH